jgi:hypothetical protein
MSGSESGLREDDRCSRMWGDLDRDVFIPRRSEYGVWTIGEFVVIFLERHCDAVGSIQFEKKQNRFIIREEVKSGCYICTTVDQSESSRAETAVTMEHSAYTPLSPLSWNFKTSRKNQVSTSRTAISGYHRWFWEWWNQHGYSRYM